MVDVSKPPLWWTGLRREVRLTFYGEEIDALVKRLRRVDDAFSRDLVAKIEATLGK